MDLDKEKVTVQTRTLNFGSVIDSRSHTTYFRSPNNGANTDYNIWVRAAAFPTENQRQTEHEESEYKNVSSRQEGWSLGMGLGKKVEEFTANKLLGNVKQVCTWTKSGRAGEIETDTRQKHRDRPRFSACRSTARLQQLTPAALAWPQGEASMNALLERIRRKCLDSARGPWLCRTFS